MFFQGEYVYVVFDPYNKDNKIHEVFAFRPDAEYYLETHPGLVVSARKLRPLGWEPESHDMIKLKAMLKDSLSDKGIEQWLNANNTLLKMSPREALRKGMNKEVFEAAHSFVEGNYV